jgi:hypothetical protein
MDIGVLCGNKKPVIVSHRFKKKVHSRGLEPLSLPMNIGMHFRNKKTLVHY